MAPQVRALGKPVTSMEKVKSAVESKSPNSGKPVRSSSFEDGEPINPKSGMTKSEEERAEFGVVIKVILLLLIAVIGVALALYYNQREVVEFLNENF